MPKIEVKTYVICLRSLAFLAEFEKEFVLQLSFEKNRLFKKKVEK